MRRLFPTLLIGLAMTVGTSLASRLNDPETSPAFIWGIGLLAAVTCAAVVALWLKGAQREWRQMSVPHGRCPDCGHDLSAGEPSGSEASVGDAPCPGCGRPIH